MKKPFVIGMAGGTAGGKSEFSDLISRTAEPGIVTVISSDSYYLPQDNLAPEVRARMNYDHPDAIDFHLLINHVESLTSGRLIEVPVYDFSRHTRAAETLTAHPTPIIITEGILVFTNEKLMSLFDLKIFVDAPDQVRFDRRLERDIKYRGRTHDSVHQQWHATVQPMHDQYCRPSRIHADIVVDGQRNNTDIAEAVIQKALFGIHPEGL